MTELLNPDGTKVRAVDNIKQSILTIEKLCFVLNNINIPARFAQNFLEGFSFLNQMHTQLLAQLTPEEIEEMKRQLNPPTPPKEGVN